MKKLLPLSLLLVLSLAFNACKKDKDPTPAPTKTDLLTAKPWKRTGLTVNPRLPADSTGTNFLPADLYTYLAQNGGECLNDNVKKFDKTGKFSFEQGATSCVTNADQIYGSGTWTFSSDETSMSLSLTYNSNKINTFDYFELLGTQSNYKIQQLTETTLSYTYTISDDTSTYTFTETLSNQ